MKARIVRNRKDEPRLLLTFETEEERQLFEGCPTLRPCVETRQGGYEDDDDFGYGFGDEKAPLVSWSFTIEPMMDESQSGDEFKHIIDFVGGIRQPTEESLEAAKDLKMVVLKHRDQR